MSAIVSKNFKLDRERGRQLERARSYPYEFPMKSYTYRDGCASTFEPMLDQGRTPVLAFGSNQSPVRLRQKYGHDADTVIPVERAHLKGFDVVYTARIASYGAVPAMLQAHAGAEVSLAVTWLNDRQLAVMHESEGVGVNYDFALLEDIEILLDQGDQLDDVYVYASRHGHFVHDKDAVALAAVAAKGRSWPERTTGEMLVLARDRVYPDAQIDDFILRLVGDEGFRRVCTEALGYDAVPFSHSYRTIEV